MEGLSGLRIGLGYDVHAFAPVSYTHLDVYKRQVTALVIVLGIFFGGIG